MKYIYLVLIALLCACGPYETVKITMPNGFTVTAEIADTPQKAELGLMNRTSLGKHKGMIFPFDKDDSRLFWMKNTYINLDILFITADKKIASISANVPRSYKDTPQEDVALAGGYGKYVLELPAGTAARENLKEGDTLVFNL